MFKFVSSNGQETQYADNICEVNKTISPFKEIVTKNDFSGFSIALDNQSLSLADTFQLQVNVKEVGVFHFIFNKEGFDKDDIISRVSSLKDIEVNDMLSAKNKVTFLLNIVDKPCLLFMVYEEYDGSYLDVNYFRIYFHKNIQTFFIRPERDIELYELNIGDSYQVEAPRTKKFVKVKTEKREKTNYLKLINEKKFHFLLIIVSSTLFEVSIPLAIINIYSSNAIYIFLFVCSLIGVGMDCYSYYDLFKRTDPKSQLSILSYVSNAIGIGIGIGLFALFYHLSDIGEGIPSVGSMILIGLLICLILCAAVVVISYFLPKKNRQSKKSDL